MTIDAHGHTTLRLQGSFYLDRVIALRPVREPVVFGELEDGSAATVLGAHHDLANTLGQEYFGIFAMFGAHITPSELIDEVTFTATQLDNFLQAPAGVACDSRPLGARWTGSFRDVTVTFAVVRSDETALADDVPRSCVTLSVVGDWNTAWEIATKLSVLLTLLAGASSAIDDVKLRVRGVPVRVVAAMRTTASGRAPDRGPTSLISTFDDIPDLVTLVARFDEFELAMRQALNPFLGYLNNPGDISVSAAQIAQALESYHRDRRDSSGKHRFEQTSIGKKRFAEIKGALALTMEREFPDYAWMLDQLRDDRPLRSRICDLYREHREFLDLITDEPSLARDATKNRNFFSHGNSGALTPEKVRSIFWSGERLRFLFYALFLVELGFSRDDAHQLLRRNDRFLRLQTLWHSSREPVIAGAPAGGDSV